MFFWKINITPLIHRSKRSILWFIGFPESLTRLLVMFLTRYCRIDWWRKIGLIRIKLHLTLLGPWIQLTTVDPAMMRDLANWIKLSLEGRTQWVVVKRYFILRLETCSKWYAQELMLGPLLIIIYIYDMEGNESNIFSKFVDDIKIGVVVESKIMKGSWSTGPMGRSMADGVWFR